MQRGHRVEFDRAVTEKGPDGLCRHLDCTSGLAQCEVGGDRDFLPCLGLNRELLATACGEHVRPHTAVVIRVARLGLDPATLPQAVDRKLKGALLHLQHLVGHQAGARADGEAMRGSCWSALTMSSRTYLAAGRPIRRKAWHLPSYPEIERSNVFPEFLGEEKSG